MQQYLALTYERAEALLATARSEVRGKPVANNTRLFRRGPDVIALRFHETDVVTFHADGRITLASGGWRTMSTKDRMNHTAGITVYSDRAEWFVKTPGHEAVPYFDGMTFADDGSVLSGGITAEEWKEHLRFTRERRKAVKGYVDGFIRALREGIPLPSGGDCWFCALTTQTGEKMGDHAARVGGDQTHLLDHIEESYYVPSLLVNAVYERGYGNPQVVLSMMMDREAWEEHGQFKLRDRDTRDLRDTLTRYLWKRLRPIATPTTEGVLVS